MKRIVILGGGVGGTLTANLLARRLRPRMDRGDVEVTVVDPNAAHVYQPGFMYIAMGGEREDKLSKPERSLLDKRVRLITDSAVRVDEASQTVILHGGAILPYDELVLATGSQIVPEAVEHFDAEAHHFYTPEVGS